MAMLDGASRMSVWSPTLLWIGAYANAFVP